jgi:hypothetical protein
MLPINLGRGRVDEPSLNVSKQPDPQPNSYKKLFKKTESIKQMWKKAVTDSLRKNKPEDS